MGDPDAVSQLREVVDLLRSNRSQEVQKAGVDILLKMTGTPEGCGHVHEAEGTVACLRLLTDDSEIIHKAISALTNLAAEDGEGVGAETMLERGVVGTIMGLLARDRCPFRVEALMLLSNLTRNVVGAGRMMQSDNEDLRGLHMRKLLHWYTSNPVRSVDGPAAEWDHVAYITFNVSQTQEGRDLLRRRSTGILAQIIPQLRSASVLRRRGTAGTLYNMCFEEEDHYWLLNEVKIVPQLLYPMVGPEEFSLEDKTGMDPLIWMEGPDKVRENDEETLQMLLKALLLLCTTRRGREKLRAEKVYEVIKVMDEALAEAKGDAEGDAEVEDGAAAGVGAGAGAAGGDTYVPTLAEQELGISDLIYKLVNMLQRDEEFARIEDADRADAEAREGRREEKRDGAAAARGKAEGAAAGGGEADLECVD